MTNETREMIVKNQKRMEKIAVQKILELETKLKEIKKIETSINYIEEIEKEIDTLEWVVDLLNSNRDILEKREKLINEYNNLPEIKKTIDEYVKFKVLLYIL